MNIIKFTHTNDAVVKHFPPLPAKKMIPEWYKKLTDSEIDELPDYFDNRLTTVKSCMPVLDVITTGYILRCPEEIQLKAEYSGEKNLETFGYTANRESAVSHHPHQQCPIKIDGKRKNYFKINTEWKIITPPGYSCYITHPSYSFEDRFEFLSGIIDTDTFDSTFNMIGYLKTQDKVFLKPGDPLVQVIPFKREEWTHETQQVDKHKDSILSLYLSINTITRVYKNLMHSKKKFD